MAQQQQNLAPKDISFDVGNVTFSHHMTPVNGIQLHYVIGGTTLAAWLAGDMV
jgi:hypothetical protein